MGKIRFYIRDKTHAKLRKFAAEEFGKKRGYIKATFIKAIDKWIEEHPLKSD